MSWKSLIRAFAFSLLFLGGSPTFALPGKKYDTAVVFSGGGPQIAMFIGMYDGLIEAGITPDLIVATCGGTVASAIIQSFPDREERLRFLHSEEFHRFNFSPIYHKNENILFDQLFAGITLVGIRANYFFGSHVIPRDLFSTYFVTLPEKSGLPQMDQPIAPWNKTDGVPAVVMVAGETDIGQPGRMPGNLWLNRRLIREAYFTDSETGAMLEGYEAAISREPGSNISALPRVILGKDKEIAVRASISDPYYFNPFQLDGHYYVTGGIDLYPFEVAQHLAHQVVMSYDNLFPNSTFVPIHKNLAGYDNNSRLRRLVQQKARAWIDRTDFMEMADDIGFSPGIVHGKFVSRVPQEFEKFKERIDAQLAWGRDRAIEAIVYQDGSLRPENDQTHIRKKHSPRKRSWLP